MRLPNTCNLFYSHPSPQLAHRYGKSGLACSWRQAVALDFAAARSEAHTLHNFAVHKRTSLRARAEDATTGNKCRLCLSCVVQTILHVLKASVCMDAQRAIMPSFPMKMHKRGTVAARRRGGSKPRKNKERYPPSGLVHRALRRLQDKRRRPSLSLVEVLLDVALLKWFVALLLSLLCLGNIARFGNSLSLCTAVSAQVSSTP